ncbi:hypothetical protein CASFOL_015038 [Castilleja foliolosa]|uniref:Uncharacterized protein n=1 Tax=Castilleja foliolosa TaxID=1961234 RepID=A0ABD3DCL9_9LAMI
MRREGRQRGMVRTFPILSPAYNPRPSTKLCGPPTAGLFTKAPSKPTNHSKFTSKCGRPKCNDCHIEPSCKSKEKAKGTHKTRSPSADVGLITWSGVESSGRITVSGYSATHVLDYLDDGESDDDCYVDDDCGGDGGGECYDDNNVLSSAPPPILVGIEIGIEDDDDNSSNNSSNPSNLSFCEVGVFCGSMDGDDEGWCLVEDNL